MFRPEKHFCPTFDAAKTKFKWIKDSLSNNNNWKKNNSGSNASCRFSHRLGLITHFPPVSKSAPNPSDRVQAPGGSSPDDDRTTRGPLGKRTRFSFDNFKLKIGDYILSESAAWFHFAWGKVALRLSMAILKFPDVCAHAQCASTT